MSKPDSSTQYLLRYVVAITAFSILLSGVTQAQTPPDAGSVLRQIEQDQRRELPPESEPQIAEPTPMDSSGGATITVEQYRFVGNTLLSDTELAKVVEPYADRPAGFAELQAAAMAVAEAYRDAGWVVRAFLPQQDVTDGTVTVEVVEAKLGDVQIEGSSTRMPAERSEAFVKAAQAPGESLNAASVDRGLLLINDLPGVSATGRFSAGALQAQTDLIVETYDEPLVDGSLNVDNAGSRFTGEERLIVAASLNNRFGFGDRAEALLLHSDGSDYARLAYSLAAGNRGLRLGLNASHLNYDLVSPEFEALDVDGTSTTVEITADYPLLRSRFKNLYLSLNGANRSFDNQAAGTTTTDYSVRRATVGLFGNMYDSFQGGGASSASFEVVQGYVDLDGSPNQSVDALTTRTAGSFTKMLATVSRLQAVTDRVSVYAQLSGQLASKNLDSSEKFFLGGSRRVRAYPENEAGGSQGVLASLEVRTQLPRNLNATAFFDYGSVRVNKDNDIIGAVTDNHLTLKGGGVALGWKADFGLNVRATLARRAGDNPNPTVTGTDQDGSLKENRVWLQVSMPF